MKIILPVRNSFIRDATGLSRPETKNPEENARTPEIHNERAKRILQIFARCQLGSFDRTAAVLARFVSVVNRDRGNSFRAHSAGESTAVGLP